MMHDAIVNAGASVRENCIINKRALLEHDATLADHCHISTGAVLNGNTAIEYDRATLRTVASMAIQRFATDLAIVAVGSNAVPERLMQQLTLAGFEWATLVDPSAFMSPRVVLGEGSAVMAGTIVGTWAHLGVAILVNYGAMVDHHATVDDYGDLGVNASMAGETLLGRAAWMQAVGRAGLWDDGPVRGNAQPR